MSNYLAQASHAQDLTLDDMREILRARLGPNALLSDIYMRVHDDCYFYVPAEKPDEP